MVLITPRGFKDVLPQEANWREAISRQVQAAFSLWGYEPIETPILEVLDVLEQGGTLDKATFKLFDSDGKLLVLRPDVTLPIARLVASRLSASPEVLRFRYNQHVAKYRVERSCHIACHL